MDINMILEFISGQGFAIFIATYVIVRLDKTLQANTEALQQLSKSNSSKTKEDDDK